jgi:hypothetical protein
MTDEQKPKTLQDLVVESIKETNLKILEESPFRINNFSTMAANYILTKKNIRQVTQIECQHKEKEEWLYIYIIEYNEGKIDKDYPRIITKQDLLKDVPKQEEGTLKFLTKDNYVVLIHPQTKETKDEAEKIFQTLEKLGLDEIEGNYKRINRFKDESP